MDDPGNDFGIFGDPSEWSGETQTEVPIPVDDLPASAPLMPLPAQQPAAQPPARGQPMQYQPPAPMPVPVPPAPVATARRSAGMGLLMVVGGATLGGMLGGGWGAAAGALLVGGVRNAIRAKSTWGSADPNARNEAARNATVAVIGIGAGGYCVYRANNRED